MSALKRCSFYRDSETWGVGYCDLDYDKATCKGDLKLCEKPDALRKHLLKQKKMEGGMEIGEKKKCPLFRKSESLTMGRGIGYCDIDSYSTICEGDVNFCEKPDALKQYLQEKAEEFDKKKL